MEQKYLIDTNVLIDAQMKRLPESSLNFLAKIINENFTISFITYIEFLGYRDVSKVSQEFISLANVLEIDVSIIKICVDLRKNYSIKLPDAIIAATVLSNNFTLVTNNENDFFKIKNLKILNPYKLSF